MRLFNKIALLCSVICFMASCWRLAELPDRNIKRKVLPSELIGNWSMTEKSYSRINCRHQSSTAITKFFLKNDSTVIAPIDKFFQKLYVNEPFFQYDKDTMIGKWEVLKDKICYGCRVDSAYVLKLIFYDKGYPKIEQEFYMAEENKEIILWLYFGDPDNVVYQDYKKIK